MYFEQTQPFHDQKIDRKKRDSSVYISLTQACLFHRLLLPLASCSQSLWLMYRPFLPRMFFLGCSLLNSLSGILKERVKSNILGYHIHWVRFRLITFELFAFSGNNNTVHIDLFLRGVRIPTILKACSHRATLSRQC